MSYSELQSANEEMSPSATHQTLLYMLTTLGQWWRGGDNSPVGTGQLDTQAGAGRGVGEDYRGRAQLLCIVLASDYQVNKVATQRGTSADQPETSNKGRGLSIKMGAIGTIFRF